MNKPAADRPRTAPATLSDEARKLWRTLTTEYSITDTGGLLLLRAALEAFDRSSAARAAIERDGMTITDRFGQAKPHPLLAAERDARAGMVSALRALNLDLEPVNDFIGRPPGR